MAVAPKFIGMLRVASVAHACRFFVRLLGTSCVEAFGRRGVSARHGIGMKILVAGEAAPALANRFHEETKGVAPVREPVSSKRSASVFGYRCLLVGGGV
jgi:hypothetical protein